MFESTDLGFRDDQEEILDKSIAARHATQFISSQIADEGRLNNHEFACNNKTKLSVEKHLVRKHSLVELEFPKETTDEQMFPIPYGLHRHEVYLINSNILDS